MKIVLQRVKQSSVHVDGQIISQIEKGYLLFVGFEREDHEGLLGPMLEKIGKIKLFPDQSGRLGLNLKEADGALLIVSQFTLSAGLKKGTKPNFSKAMEPEMAEILYHQFVMLAGETDVQVGSGEFGAMMQVHIQNDGPVTVLMDSREILPSLH